MMTLLVCYISDLIDDSSLVLAFSKASCQYDDFRPVRLISATVIQTVVRAPFSQKVLVEVHRARRAARVSRFHTAYRSARTTRLATTHRPLNPLSGARPARQHVTHGSLPESRRPIRYTAHIPDTHTSISVYWKPLYFTGSGAGGYPPLLCLLS